MIDRKLLRIIVVVGFLVGALLVNGRRPACAEEDLGKTYKVLSVSSYHTPWEFTDEQVRGFKDALSGLKVEYKDFYMDAKRKSSNEDKERSSSQARELIDTWKPDLVYTNDDDAQQYVARYYVNKTIPFVFSGVNKEPQDYGFVGSENVAGILERFYFIETVELLRNIVPSIHRIAVISDDAPMWATEIERAKKLVAENYKDNEIEFICWDRTSTFSEYKDKIIEYQSKADAIVLFGQFTLKDEKGDWAPFADVQKWVVENSKLPDAAFADDRVKNGTLAAMAVSAYEQGRLAGEIARGILTEGKSPSAYSFQKSSRGKPMINIKRANLLGIKVNSTILLTAKVVDKFEWEDK